MTRVTVNEVMAGFRGSLIVLLLENGIVGFVIISFCLENPSIVCKTLRTTASLLDPAVFTTFIRQSRRRRPCR